MDDVVTAGKVLATGTARYINRRAYWRVPDKGRLDGLEVEVIIRDVRVHFGTPDFLVEPVSGRGGGRWVRADYLTLVEEE